MYRLRTALIEDYEKQYGALEGPPRGQLAAQWRLFVTLLVLDVLLCHIVIGPAVIAFWRGTWDGSTHFIEEQFGVEPLVLNLSALGLGLVGTLLIDVQHHAAARLAGQVGTLQHAAASRLFSFAWGIVDIALWKGIWDGLDTVAGKRWEVACCSLSLGLLSCLTSGVLKTALSMPTGISVDVPATHIQSHTYMDSTAEQGLGLRLLDGGMSRLLEGAVVLIWHGVWTLTDIATTEWYPISHRDSALVSYCIGLVLGVIVFLMQFLMLYCTSHFLVKKNSAPMWLLCLNLVYTFLGILATICSFRGIWNLLDIYYLPDHIYVSYASSLVIGFLILDSFRCCSCLHAGIFRDDVTQGVTIPYYLLSQFFVESLSNSNQYGLTEGGDSCEKKLLAVEGGLVVEQPEPKAAPVVLLLPPPRAQMEPEPDDA